LGIEETKYTAVNDDEIIVIVSNGEDTKNIIEGDIFPIGKKEYKCLSIQDIIQPGLLIIKMKVILKSVEIKTEENITNPEALF